MTGIPITYNVIALSVECFNVKYSEHRVCDEAALRLRRIAHLSDPTQLRRRSWNSLGKPPKAITLKNVVYRIYRIEIFIYFKYYQWTSIDVLINMFDRHMTSLQK